jgi:hypothetical protein
MTRKIFEGMDGHSKAFYSRVFNTALLNLHAVRRGYFDILICESDDPLIMLRWREAVPQIVMMIKLDNMRDI